MRGALEVVAGALIAGRYRVRRVLGQGEGRSRREAETEAARNALTDMDGRS